MSIFKSPYPRSKTLNPKPYTRFDSPKTGTAGISKVMAMSSSKIRTQWTKR